MNGLRWRKRTRESSAATGHERRPQRSQQRGGPDKLRSSWIPISRSLIYFAVGLAIPLLVPANAFTRLVLALGTGGTLCRPGFEAPLTALEGRRVIFVISPGRSGTKYLASLLQCSPIVAAFHEPPPTMNGETLRSLLLGQPGNHTTDELMTKWMGIVRSLQGSAPGVVYAETSNMFAKTWLESILPVIPEDQAQAKNILSLLDDAVIIVLRRSVFDTISSQYRLGWFSPGHSGEANWYYHPSQVTKQKQLVPPGDWELGSVLSNLVGYNLDIELRAQRAIQMASEFENVRVVEVDLEQLVDATAAQAFLGDLGLPVDERKLAVLKNKELNSRSYKQAVAGRALDAQELRSHIAKATRLMQTLGYQVPERWT